MVTENIQLIHGDFFTKYLSLAQNSFNMILTSPPWGILSEAGQKWDVKIDWVRLEKIFASLLIGTGWLIIFGDFLLAVELVNTFTHYFEYHGLHLWQKPSGSPAGKTQPIHNSEHILLFRQKGVRVNDLTFNKWDVMPRGDQYYKPNYSQDFSTRRQKKSAFNENTTGKRHIKTFLPQVLHGNSKPNMTKAERLNLSHPNIISQAVLQPIIRTYSNPGDKILDPFGGSFSTVLAGLTVGNRHITSFEKDPSFYKEGEERIKVVMQQTNLGF